MAIAKMTRVDLHPDFNKALDKSRLGPLCLSTMMGIVCSGHGGSAEPPVGVEDRKQGGEPFR